MLYAVDALLATQEPEGYLGTYPPDRRRARDVHSVVGSSVGDRLAVRAEENTLRAGGADVDADEEVAYRRQPRLTSPHTCTAMPMASNMAAFVWSPRSAEAASGQ